MKKIKLLAALIILVLAGGCQTNQKANSTNREEALSENKNGNFIIYASNQSFAINPVDIKIYIDGKIAVNNKFDVKGKRVVQHNWRRFQFDLAAGQHKLRADSIKGAASLEAEFEIKDKHWAVIAYYYPKAGGGAFPTQKYFTFDIQDKQIGLE